MNFWQVGFWVVRAVSAAWFITFLLVLLLLRNWEGLRSRAIGRYQEILLAGFCMALLL